MKINWIARKEINFNEIENILQDSIKSNQFTNGGPCVKKLGI